MTVFENNSFGGFREGCGTLKASGGDYGGSENLVVALTINAGGAQQMPDNQNFNSVMGVNILQTPTNAEGVSPCLSAGSTNGEAVLGVVQQTTETTYIVRRLTPLECERLQGFPDGWTDIGPWTDTKGKVHKESSDSARYKALGNSIALPSWYYVLQRLSLCCAGECTMASLFDGIGGFPLIWEGLNGAGSCLWASEIEEFPIAVTKYHFPDNTQETNRNGGTQ